MWISLSSIRQMIMGSAGMGSLLLVGLPTVWADSPQGSTIYHSHPAPADSYSESHAAPTMDSHYSPPMLHSEQLARPAYAVLPPPGTLGQTYLRRSWPIPKDEHPRTGIVQIDAPGFTEIEVEGLVDLEGFHREDGVWIFKTKKPLTPGVPHIYQIKAGYKQSQQRKEVRTLRLIPGRVVTLDF
ncbi:MAG: hypothetical protein KDA84_03750 [Planctomycetaceae bacterium]|nr:hypothetical protein [Planctomycetaceae bacterium]